MDDVLISLPGARRVLALIPDARRLENHVAALERASVENAPLALDLAKSLIETACKTIMNDRGVTIPPGDDLPRLFKQALESFPLLPPDQTHRTEIRDALKKTINGMATAVQGLCELRNNDGIASHGRDALDPQLTSIEALFAARIADAVVAMLYDAHHRARGFKARVVPRYDDRADFNTDVDELHPDAITIFNATYKASEVLFHVDQVAYAAALADFDAREVE